MDDISTLLALGSHPLFGLLLQTVIVPSHILLTPTVLPPHHHLPAGLALGYTSHYVHHPTLHLSQESHTKCYFTIFLNQFNPTGREKPINSSFSILHGELLASGLSHLVSEVEGLSARDSFLITLHDLSSHQPQVL